MPADHRTNGHRGEGGRRKTAPGGHHDADGRRTNGPGVHNLGHFDHPSPDGADSTRARQNLRSYEPGGRRRGAADPRGTTGGHRRRCGGRRAAGARHADGRRTSGSGGRRRNEQGGRSSAPSDHRRNAHRGAGGRRTRGPGGRRGGRDLPAPANGCHGLHRGRRVPARSSVASSARRLRPRGGSRGGSGSCCRAFRPTTDQGGAWHPDTTSSSRRSAARNSARGCRQRASCSWAWCPSGFSRVRTALRRRTAARSRRSQRGVTRTLSAGGHSRDGS